MVDAATNRSYQSIRPDIVVERRNAVGASVRLPIDAKYKLYEDAKVSASDLYQAFIYGYAYGSTTTGRAYLLFPSLAAARTDIRVRNDADLWGATISAVGIPLNDILAAMDAGQVPAVPVLDEIVAEMAPRLAAA